LYVNIYAKLLSFILIVSNYNKQLCDIKHDLLVILTFCWKKWIAKNPGISGMA